MGNKKPIDELFRTKLNDLEADTPYDAWPELRERIDRKNSRKRAAWWRYSSVAAAVLLAFFSGYYFNHWEISPQRPVKQDGQPGWVVDEPAERNQPENTAPLLEEGVNPREERENTVAGSDHPGAAGTTPNSTESTLPPNRKNNGREPGGHTTSIEPAKNDVAVEAESIALLEPDHKVTETPDTEVSEEEQQVLPELSNARTYLAERNSSDEKPSSSSETIFSQKVKPIADDATRKRSRNSSGVELSLLAGPTVPFMDVHVKDESTITQNNVRNENLDNTYATGLKVLVRNDNNWEWQAGVMVNNWVQNSNNVLLSRAPSESVGTSTDPNATVNSEVNGFTSVGNVAFDQNANREVSVTNDLNQYYLVPNISQQYQFVEVPVGAAYYLVNGRFELKLQAGVNTRILSNSTVYLEYPDGTTSDFEGLKPNDLSLQLSTGPGFAYRLAPRLKLRIDPMLYYGITPVNRGDDVETYYHQLLFFSGISYRF